MTYMLRFLLFLSFISPIYLSGQCMTVEKPLQDLLDQAALVVEGKVISQQGYRDVAGKNIYTVNKVQVFNKFKGILLTQTINVVTQGGVVGLEMEKVSHALELEVGEMGLFVLEALPVTIAVPGNLYRPVETVLGFLRYDLLTDTATGVFNTYEDIQGQLYTTITDLVQLPIVPILLWDEEDSAIVSSSSVESALVSEGESSSNTTFEFHAGIGDVMTISGGEFGVEQGAVLFADANSGGNGFIAALDNQILEWTPSRIKVEIPYRAGTGRIRINKADGQSVVSSEDVLLGYDHINIKYVVDEETSSYETQLFADNSIDGYDFQFFTDFANNSGAAQGFENLMETWGCTTGVNFKRGADSTIDEDANDGVNIVRFDNGDELGGSTLAYARSRYSGCYQGDTIKWFVYEVEVVMNDDYNWYYGDGLPANNEFDFETVMLHEIGHTQQLGHVINSNEVMHFSVGPGQQKRELSTLDKIGGQYVTDKSTTEQVCNLPLMEYYTSCCEALEIVAQPTDTFRCEEDTRTPLRFLVENAETIQWQKLEANTWVNVVDDENYEGSTTGELIVLNNFTSPITYRAMASNSCSPSILSNEVSVKPVILDFFVTLKNPTCETMGSIVVESSTNTDDIAISINGGVTFVETMSSTETEKEILVSDGTYNVVIKHTASGCSIELGIVEIIEETPLVLSATIEKYPDCKGGKGSITVRFNDHPFFENIALSLDNGVNFTKYDDALGSITIPDLEEDTYEIIGRWEDASCSKSVMVILETDFPEITITTRSETCEGAGLITLQRTDTSTPLEVSMNGEVLANSWNSGAPTFTIEAFEGTYQIGIINTDTTCKMALPLVSISPAVPIVLSALIKEQPDCDEPTGTIRVDFNDHPDYEKIRLSLDGGLTYQEISDSLGSVEISNLRADTYQIMAQWSDESCATGLLTVILESMTYTVGNCRSVELTLDPDGQAVLTPEALYDFSSEVGCPDVKLQVDTTNFSCNELGENEVQLMITTIDGQTTYCNSIVTITDPNNFCALIEDGEAVSPEESDETMLNNSAPKVIIFPNPSSDFVYFVLDEQAYVFLQLFDTSGALVLEEQLEKDSSDHYYQNIQRLQSGIYTVKLSLPSGSIKKSLIIN
ncbi:T9SS type A sorting domain-containing protein [Maribacter sp. X9]|uniref:T9SS type A sorting domain-containing protein n=1 Tax=Maribacter sp. X9 TaxID=3402159 RepID=UPI003AF3B67E